MKVVRIIIVIALFFNVGFLIAQQTYHTQNIRGKIIDSESKSPLPGANVIILGTKPPIGTVTDDDGYFKLENVSVGRHDIQASFIGYTPEIFSEIMLTSGKEVFLNIELEEYIAKIGEILVKPAYRKHNSINKMAMISARSFTVEESQRYAGGITDPARMVSSFAGVSVGGDLQNNEISVRGHTPNRVKWHVEGIEIPNPNHFGGIEVAGAGFLCMISPNLLDNSDFLTGAFPAEYGDALGAVFDINLRKGNNEKRENTFKVGYGLEFSSEGPIVKGKKASYNVNYRYSTMSLLVDLGILTVLPKFHDLSFNVNLPSKKLGELKLWGVGGINKLFSDLTTDTTKWEWDDARTRYKIASQSGVIGLTHKINLNKKSFFNTTVASTLNNQNIIEHWAIDELTINKNGDYTYNRQQLIFSTFLKYKFSARHTHKIGFEARKYFYQIDLGSAFDRDDPTTFSVFSKRKGEGETIKAYAQSKIKLSPNFVINAGIYTQWFAFNKKYTLEPRLGFNWEFLSNHSISGGYGLHSQLEELRFYAVKGEVNDKEVYFNDDLDFSKAHHFIIGYNWRINKNLRLKIEPYYHKLFDIPGIKDSPYSLINFTQEWDFQDSLQNNTKGENYGIDITFERFLHNGMYYLITASIFNSKYTGSDNITRHTHYNRSYVTNFLIGKEFRLKQNNGNNILSINCKLNFVGGKRYTPYDLEKSLAAEEIVDDESKMFTKQYNPNIFLDFSLQYRINKAKLSHIFTVEALNLLMFANGYDKYSYNKDTHTIEKYREQPSTVPFATYTLEF